MICPLCDEEMRKDPNFHELRMLADHLLDYHTDSMLLGGAPLRCTRKMIEGINRECVQCWCGWIGPRRIAHKGSNAQTLAEHLATYSGVAHIFDLMLGIDRP